MNDKPNEKRNLETIKTNNLPDPLDIDLADLWSGLPDPWPDLPDLPDLSGLDFPDPLKSLDGLPDMASLDFPDPLKSLADLPDQLGDLTFLNENEEE